MEALRNYLESKEELFHSQIDQFQELVVRHYQLTGVNPIPQQLYMDFLFAEVKSSPTEVLQTARATSDIVSDAGPSTALAKRGRGRPKGSRNSTTSVNTKPKMNVLEGKEDKVVPYCPTFVSRITKAEGQTGNQKIVASVLMRFDAARRRFTQLGNVTRPLDTCVNNCKNLGVRTNMQKRIGLVPGVEIGDIFFVWGEMNLVGLHMPTVGGIGCLEVKDGVFEGPFVNSVVASGHPGDETTGLESLIYTGEGGPDKDQKLERGNLALRASYIKGNDIRVIRSQQDPNNNDQKIYIYDGLYILSDFWKRKNELHVEEFKVRLVRKPDQQSGYAIWKSIENWRKYGLESRKGVLHQDLSFGNETSPVPVVNEVNENDGNVPEVFGYINSQYYSLLLLEYKTDLQSLGCNNCQGQTCYSDCLCLQKNDGKLPYDDQILVCRKPMVYECGEFCSCSLDCKMRVLQRGLKIRVEVFKTEKCGWGLRSWDPIRAGSFICEFAGVSKTEREVEEEEEEDNEYLFDSSRFYNQFRWNFEPELVAEENREPVSEAFDLSSRVLISAKEYGNVARFMNHSCSPNVMWQPIEYEKNSATYVRIGFFALKHIPPLTELRYDYGMSGVAEEVGEDGNEEFIGKYICLCGSDNCQGSFG